MGGQPTSVEAFCFPNLGNSKRFSIFSGDLGLKKHENTRFPIIGNMGMKGRQEVTGVNVDSNVGQVLKVNQSPINLMPHMAVSDTTMGPLSMQYNLHVNYDIINVGYTVAISIRNRKSWYRYVENGMLKKVCWKCYAENGR